MAEEENTQLKNNLEESKKLAEDIQKDLEELQRQLLKDKELIDIFGEELLPISFYDGKIKGKNISIKQMGGFKKGVFKKTPCY